MKSSLLAVGVLLSSPFACYSMKQETDLAVIANASYYIIKGQEKSIIHGGIPARTSDQQATFYTASGDPVTTVTGNQCDFFQLKQKIDPQAPKPKPKTYAIKYWPAIQLRGGLTKGVPGYFIVFSDKHGNSIKSYRYNEKTKKITVFSEGKTKSIDSITDLKNLNLQDCKEGESDEIKERPYEEPSSSCIIQ